MSRAERAATLAHDVGKYVARVAKNVAPGAAVPRALVPLLVRDLYELPSGARASARFDALSAGLEHPRLADARERLRSIDALEQQVRAGDDEACRAACAHAREVESILRALAKEHA